MHVMRDTGHYFVYRRQFWFRRESVIQTTTSERAASILHTTMAKRARERAEALTRARSHSH